MEGRWKWRGDGGRGGTNKLSESVFEIPHPAADFWREIDILKLLTVEDNKFSLDISECAFKCIILTSDGMYLNLLTCNKTQCTLVTPC